MWVLNLCFILFLISASSGFDIKDYETINSYSNFTQSLKELLESDDRKISSGCKGDLGQYLKSLLSLKNKDLWAMQMFDAGTKIPAGMLDGMMGDLGSFDECINIEAITSSYQISGRYCLGTILLSTEDQSNRQAVLQGNPEVRGFTANGIGISFATCMPSKCAASEVQEIYSKLSAKIAFSDDMCKTKDYKPALDGGAIAAISFFGIILGLMAISTAYDVALYYTNKKPHHPVLIAFSVVTNTKKILATSNDSSQISCLHGIRVISTMWVILGHRYSTQASFPLKNLFDVGKWQTERINMFIMEATVSVDTFFVMAGMVISYTYMKAMAKGTKFNIVMYYLHRYIRLTPALAVIILIHAQLLRYFGSGPLWTNDSYFSVGCQDHWWKTLLYIQNYANSGLMCVPQSWYLSVDTQLFLLSPLLLIPMKKWPKFALGLTAFLTVCSILTCFLTGWFFELRSSILTNVDPEKANDYFYYYYSATQTRAAPWLIGIILGYIVYTAKQKKIELKINMFITVAAWFAAIIVLLTCLFGGHDLILGNESKVANSFHIALVRPAWSIGVGFIILACVMEHGGPVNWFLSLPIFQILSKLTYTMYLTHFTIMYVISAQMRDVIRFSNGHMLYVFWGDFILTVALSFVLTLAFESPLITIEKFIFGGLTRRKASPPPPAPEREHKIKLDEIV